MNNEKIQELISCPKNIIEKPKRSFKIKGMHKENDFILSAKNSNEKFLVRLRKHSEFVENFSIMLEYFEPELQKDIKLIRFNGPHQSTHKNTVINNETWSSKSHVHIATQEAIEAGQRAEHYAEITEEYQVFEEALILFWQRVNITEDIENYFPNIRQRSLFKIIK